MPFYLSPPHYSLIFFSLMSDNKQSILVLIVSVLHVFPAQANDGVTVDQTQSFYVGGEWCWE